MTRAAFAALLLLSAAPAAAETIAIRGGTLALGDGAEPIQGGTVVIRDGRVVAAGLNIGIPSGARIVDATGKWVTPGFVSGYSQLGINEVDLGAERDHRVSRQRARSMPRSTLPPRSIRKSRRLRSAEPTRYARDRFAPRVETTSLGGRAR